MKQVEFEFPLPYFIINKNFTIHSYSREAARLFQLQEDFLQIVDEESRDKVKAWVIPEKIQTERNLEVLLKPLNQLDPFVADLYVNWTNDLYAQVVVVPKDEQVSKVAKSLAKLRTRLNDTNFELLEEKEKLEKAVQQNNKLSAPFIELTSTTAVVPLFGDLTWEKLDAVQENLLVAAQRKEKDRLLFDFTAVGNIKKDGIHVLISLMTALFYMGTEVTVTGITPVQVKELYETNLPSRLQFIHSLESAIQTYCT
ncbi:STAS domain-containing protein [Halobacillus salinarum]|uniref:STAS domain-containing protein n=1 Tax=Halobacillus salinarum TaxID=2932257 RepID=A0ABY4EPU3_9BACI|nr:STAS domain-containing protein [Halobacillus salinarum]UOQ46010.1 STAS domain-containing protein [Halobacillus salinarum]